MGYLLFDGSAVKSRMLDSTRDSSEMCVGSCAKKQNETKYTHTHIHTVSRFRAKYFAGSQGAE